MPADDRARTNRVQEQPWWTSGSRYALLFLVVSNVAVLLTIFVPEFSHWKDRNLQRAISESQKQQEQQIAVANQTLQALNRQVEITRLLFDHFFGKSAAEQTAVVRYLTYQFPSDLREKSLQAILVLEARKPSVARQITRSVAAIQTKPVGQSKIDVAEAAERRGFRALIAGNLAAARSAFLAAHAAYPTYHNVDELSHVVLSPKQVVRYDKATAAERPVILKNTIGLVLTTYSWGIAPDQLTALRKEFASLSAANP